MTPQSRRALAVVCLSALALAACGQSGGVAGATPAAQQAGTINVFPQNTALLVGVNRVGFALLDAQKQPVLDAQATVDVMDSGQVVESRPLTYIGHGYGKIPVYIGLAKFAHTGDYRFLVHVTLSDGRRDSGLAVATVSNKAAELPVAHNLREVKSDLRQQILGDPGVKIADIDSGVPPDSFHTTTIAQGLAQHKPMVLFLGEPGRCPSQTCGPTEKVLEQIYPQYQDRLLFEHVEIHVPASGEALNPIYVAFGLTSEPWVYFVNQDGVVTDRFEGFVTPDELRGAADGTLAGKVPAVDLTI